MECNALNCGESRPEHLRKPVVELPTVRTVGNNTAMVGQNAPTFLIGEEAVYYCPNHLNVLKLDDWIPQKQWHFIEMEARLHGRQLPPFSQSAFRWMPIGWRPPKTEDKQRYVRRAQDTTNLKDC